MYGSTEGSLKIFILVSVFVRQTCGMKDMATASASLVASSNMHGPMWTLAVHQLGAFE